MLRKRTSLSFWEIKQKSQRICAVLTQLPEFKRAKSIAFYISTKSEVHTHDLIKTLLEKKEKKVSVPVYSANVLSEISSWSELSEGAFGILEPKNLSVVNDADLIIVPGVAFDRQCNRLGHGKGFYDKLLKNYKGKSIALAYEQQIVDKIPTEDHDVKVNKIITEKWIIYGNH